MAKIIKLKKRLFFICIAMMFFCTNSFAQISPPGLGKANTVSWVAIGLSQELDTAKAWRSMSYVGLGRKSNPDNYTMWTKPAILVLNQEFYHQFRPLWQYSFALSYRSQDEYTDREPYAHKNPSLKQELRAYGRLIYVIKLPFVKIIPTFRQDIRTFYTPEFKPTNDHVQLRSRFRLQLTVDLDAKKKHRLIASSEQLFSAGNKTPNTWSSFSYKESRFLLYYSLSPEQSPLVFNIGYMNNLVGTKTIYDVHYLALDITIKNLFSMQRRPNRLSNSQTPHSHE